MPANFLHSYSARLFLVSVCLVEGQSDPHRWDSSMFERWRIISPIRLIGWEWLGPHALSNGVKKTGRNRRRFSRGIALERTKIRTLFLKIYKRGRWGGAGRAFVTMAAGLASSSQLLMSSAKSSVDGSLSNHALWLPGSVSHSSAATFQNCQHQWSKKARTKSQTWSWPTCVSQTVKQSRSPGHVNFRGAFGMKKERKGGNWDGPLKH